MKTTRTYLFIAISSIALLVLLIIQVNWIVQTAKTKEDLFNEKANMVLARTADALSSDKEACSAIGACAEKGDSPDIAAKLGKSEVHKIDSLFNYYMKFYNFHIEYSFQIVKPGLTEEINQWGLKNNTYEKPLEVLLNKAGLELKLVLPDKKQFIVAEMGPLFITSVILILIVLIMFWRTSFSLMREKRLSEHTTEFLNNMTHEFKTPLTNIALATKMISNDNVKKQEEKVKYYTGIILEENEKLKLQVEQVLGMAALERGEIPFRKVELRFSEIIEGCLKSIAMQLENRHGKVKLNLKAKRDILLGDKVHLINALSNLIENAIKYSTDNPEILIETYNTDRNLVIVISDKGIGIEKVYQKRVFDKFFRVPTGDVHNVKGFGLGLAYVKKIVELHGGTIELESEKGKGSTFTIALPNA